MHVFVVALLLMCVFKTVFVFAEPYTSANQITLWPGTPPVVSQQWGVESYRDERVYNVRSPAMYPFFVKSLHSAPAVVIFPGGGYQKLSIVKEGEEVAAWLNSLGVHAFVVKNRLKEFGAPAPLLDAQQAIRIVRSNAIKWGVDPDRIGVIGFSAGGHLAASISQRFDANFTTLPASSLAHISARPDFALLIYPVITMDFLYTHKGSREALLGQTPRPESVRYYSFDDNTRSESPKTFLVHSAKDASVPAENSLLYWQSLKKQGVDAELHIYQEGRHGFGLRDEVNPIGQWPKQAELWLRNNNLLSAPVVLSPPVAEPEHELAPEVENNVEPSSAPDTQSGGVIP